MSGYAIRNDEKGWRAVGGPEEVNADEYFSSIQPEVLAPEENPSAVRAAAYREESDPLFFKWQAGECEKSEWLNKRAEIKAR